MHIAPDPIATVVDIAARRALPPIYVLDAQHDVLFSRERGDAGADLSPRVADTVRRLAAALEVSVDDVASALVDGEELVRVVRLDGSGSRCFLVFVEPLARRRPVAAAAQRFALSRRETEVLEGLIDGDSTSSIAEHLGIGESTVLEHVKRIGRKLGVSRRVEIVARVLHER